MLPSIREILAFGNASSSDTLGYGQETAGGSLVVPSLSALRILHPATKRPESSSFEALDSGYDESGTATSMPAERPDTPSNSNSGSSSSSSKQRPGRKVGSSDRYTASQGARQYKCGVHSCAAFFKRPEHLKRHMLTHTQIRPFQCEAQGCGKRFSRRDNFLTHAKKHGADGSPSTSSDDVVGGVLDDGPLSSDDRAETGSPRGHKRTASEMSAYSRAMGSGSDDGRSRMAAESRSVVSRPVSNIFGLLNSSSDGDSPSAFSSFAAPQAIPAAAAALSTAVSTAPSLKLSSSLTLPPLELLANASSEQNSITTPNDSPMAPLLSSMLPPSSSYSSSSSQQKRPEADAEDTVLPSVHKKSRTRRIGGRTAKKPAAHVDVAVPADADGGDPSKPFTCSICDSRFGRLEHVKRHQLVHTGQRQFGCPCCNKLFARKDNMIQHLRAHKRRRGPGSVTSVSSPPP
ncbi:Zinc finger, C2H2 type [Coemansia sp. Benny D160-2]|nr:Zinc finger, C2H2 type [Coemansia sp. Benny D160-2]